ncbi:MAG: hypothetical protein ABIH42_10560 [Planctomycetota bacterium]
MSQQELLNKVVSALNSVGIEYMLTGSVVSSLQGEPRSTHDIDVVVAINEITAKKLINSLSMPGFYLSKESVFEAVSLKSMFNLIEVNTGDKVDFYILKDIPFDHSCFTRKYVEEIFGLQVFVSRPEDTILAKLRWAELCGGSDKQLTDALRVYEVQFGSLDMEYLHSWINTLGLEKLFQKMEGQAEIL